MDGRAYLNQGCFSADSRSGIAPMDFLLGWILAAAENILVAKTRYDLKAATGTNGAEMLE